MDLKIKCNQKNCNLISHSFEKVCKSAFEIYNRKIAKDDDWCSVMLYKKIYSTLLIIIFPMNNSKEKLSLLPELLD